MKIPVLKLLLGFSLLFGIGLLTEVFGTTTAYAATDTAADKTEFQNKLYAGLLQRPATYTITYTGGQLPSADVGTILGAIFDSDNYLYYSSKSYKYSWTNTANSSTYTFSFTYWESKTQADAVEAKVNEVLGTIITAGMNDFQKEKAIHDWIETNLAYDTSLVQHSAYAGLFGNKKTVCQGYALLAYKMLSKAGIENKIIEGVANKQLHTWNLVKLDGSWYHLDTTWDDPVPDVAGRIVYDYFNLTDTEIKANHTWTKTYPAAVTEFADTLAAKKTSDAANATFYGDLETSIGLPYLKDENTVQSVTGLTYQIQNAIDAHNHSLKFRYTPKSTALTDIKTAIKGFNNITRYGYGMTDFVRTPDNTDLLVTLNLDYWDPVAVTSVTMSTYAPSVNVRGTVKLAVVVGPSNATNKKVTWTSSDTNVATVNATGVVTAKTAGSVTITATTVDGSFKATADITVIQPVTGVKLDVKSKTLKIGESAFALTATVAPVNASDLSVTWTSSNPSVATVDDSGKVTAVAPGKTVITAKSANGKKAAATIIVPVPVESVALGKTDLTIDINKTAKLAAVVTPKNATDKTASWSSDNEAVATVSKAGVVSALAVGEANITVTTTDGAKTASIKIKVIQPVTGLTMDKTKTLKVSETFKLEVTIGPENATVTSLTYTSSKSSVVTVDADGSVTAVAPGKAVITVKAHNGKTAVMTITVPVSVNGVTMNKTELTLKTGKTAQLAAVISPTNATVKTVVWTSSDTSIATVNAKGLVTAAGSGTATITATTTDGSFTATSQVTVSNP
ncbi:Ig-like domain-containing protein [Cohnella candidum]|uniref:Transglutaminase n=1 Tax=Cohnella candidum TaxID=2674991 RepID=A0A3G3JTH7_9BACL|nr:Ig-like domain-containing protein [Cohnella candidum]AYQ71187.1 hypothetical protein EAV92_00325 [Cohnella candidum]